ncbi:MAG: fluoride efflux transporter CrcB [Alphaproteobacteria bacterium]|nr:fluoride efflux transporter CrcB [Alphaproteobacteria bacterium]
MAIYLWIGLGSALGGMARYWSSGFVALQFGESFPFGTLFVNVLGSFLIGVIATLTAPDGRLFVGSEMRQFLMLGILGGYTTFSSFSIETLELMRGGEWFRAGALVILSVALCLLAVWLGHAAAAVFNQLRGS